MQPFLTTKLRKDITAGAPSSLGELLALPAEKLPGTDIAAMYLLCTEGVAGPQTQAVPKVQKHLTLFDRCAKTMC